MKCKQEDSICNENLLTRQRALLKSKRRGNSPRVIVNRFTCQRALCNRGKGQGDNQRVIDTRFTCQRTLCNRGKPQGDNQRVIGTRFTCQRALCNRRKRQGDNRAPRPLSDNNDPYAHLSTLTIQTMHINSHQSNTFNAI